MLDSIMAEIAYKCDLCGELFNSPDEAEYHNQNIHTPRVSSDEFGSWVMGTSTPSDNSETVAEKNEIVKETLKPITNVDSQIDKELQEWEVESTKDGQDSHGN